MKEIVDNGRHKQGDFFLEILPNHIYTGSAVAPSLSHYCRKQSSFVF